MRNISEITLEEVKNMSVNRDVNNKSEITLDQLKTMLFDSTLLQYERYQNCKNSSNVVYTESYINVERRCHSLLYSIIVQAGLKDEYEQWKAGIEDEYEKWK